MSFYGDEPFGGDPEDGILGGGGGPGAISGTVTATQQGNTLLAIGEWPGSGGGVDTGTEDDSFGSHVFGDGAFGGPSGEEGGGGPPPGGFPRLVAFLNGPAGYIYEVDANGLTYIDMRFDGYIDMPTFSFTIGGPGDVIRYYKDPASETGSLFAENVDPAWSMDLHRGNGYLDLGLFHINDSPIGGATTGTLATTQASQTALVSARGLITGTLSSTQAGQTLFGFGEVNPMFRGILVKQQDANLLTAIGKTPSNGQLVFTQQSQFLGGSSGSTVPAIAEIVAEPFFDPVLTATVLMDAFVGGSPSVGPVLEGAVP